MALGDSKSLELRQIALHSFCRGKKRLKSLKISRAAAPMAVARECVGPGCHMLVLRAAPVKLCCVRLSGPGT